MDMSVVEIINVVGFPIFVSIALFWLNRETIANNNTNDEKFRQTIQANTETMRELIREIKKDIRK